MGLFGKIFNTEPDPKEIKAFSRGRQSSGKAAEAHAKAARDRAATKRAPGRTLADQSAAWKKGQRK